MNYNLFIRSIIAGGCIGIVLLLVALPIFFSIFVPIYSFDANPPYFHYAPFSQIQVNEVNSFVKEQYETDISPNGSKIIQSEIEKIKLIDDQNAKLDEIFRWEMNDWHNPNWEPQNFRPYNNTPLYFTYKLDPKKLRTNLNFENSFFRQQTPEGVFFADDPNWLAYNKVGACRELSNLFLYMAQKSGFESRTVKTAWDHQWAEVKINGEWRYYDPWCAVEHNFYNATDGNLTFKYKWFNTTENFRDNCHGAAYLNWYNEDPKVTFYNVLSDLNVNENPVSDRLFKNPLINSYFYNPALHLRASVVYTFSYFWHDIKSL
jgi:hypothetical protein